MKSLVEAISKEDVKNLKDYMMVAIKDQIKEDLANFYAVDEEAYTEIMQEIMAEIKEEIKSEIKEEYGEVIKSSILKAFKELK